MHMAKALLAGNVVELREEVTGVVCPSSWTVRLFDAVVS